MKNHKFKKNVTYVTIFFVAIVTIINTNFFPVISLTDASYNQQVQASNNVVTIYDVIAQANSSSNNNSKYSLDKFEEALKAADLKKTRIRSVNWGKKKK